MLRKFSIISTVLLLCVLAAPVSAIRIHWGDGGTDSMWYTPNNWYYTYEANSPADGRFINSALADPCSVNIGMGGRDRTRYPQILLDRINGIEPGGPLTDPTINVNFPASGLGMGSEFYGGGACAYAATFMPVPDPNLYHFLWINGGLNVRMSQWVLCMASTDDNAGNTGFMTVDIGDNTNVTITNQIRAAGRGGYGIIYLGDNSVIDVNNTLNCPDNPVGAATTGANAGYPEKARYWLGENAMITFYDINMWHNTYLIANTNDPLNTGKTVTGDGKINLEAGAKLRLRRGSLPHYSLGVISATRTAASYWTNQKRWMNEHINEGRITAYASLNGGVGLTNTQIIPSTTSRVNITAVEVATDPCMGKHYYEISVSTSDAGLPSNPSPADGSTPETFNGMSWTAGSVPGLTLLNHKVYYSSNQALVTSRDPSVLLATLPAATTSYDPGVNRVYGATSYWAVTEVYNSATSNGATWSFTLNYGPALNPLPADRATGLFPEQTLTWTPGLGSTATEVYLSTSFADVNTRAAGALFDTVAAPGASKGTGQLVLNTTYYWALDAIRSGGSIADPCGVRRFTTSSTILIDNFSTYIDTAALRAVWTDTPGALDATKSTTGDGDAHSMQLDYGLSNWAEVKADMDYRTDAYSISVRIRGTVGNNVKPMYVGVYDGSTYYVKAIPVADVNIALATWQEARVAFSELAGLVPANIQKIVIGVGTRGGTGGAWAQGIIYVDNVRLYPRRCLTANAEAEGADFNEDCLVNYNDITTFANTWLVAKTTPDAPTAQELLYLPLDEADPCVTAVDPIRGTTFAVEGYTAGSTWDTNGVVNGCYRPTVGGSRLIITDDWMPPTLGTNTAARDIFRPAIAGNQITLAFYLKYNANYVRNFVYQTAYWDSYANATRDNVLTFRNTSGAGGYAMWVGRTVDPNLTSRTAEIYFTPGPAHWPIDDHIGEWAHYAVVKDGPAGISRVYEDGTLLRTFDTSAVVPNTMAYPIGYQNIAEICSFSIGGACLGYVYSAAINCSIDEFRIYGGALTESNIKYLLGSSTEFFPGDAADQNLYDDNIINFKDYAEFADDFLDDNLWP